MRRTFTFAISLSLVLLAGCVQGRWQLESVNPETARPYAVADFTLHSDGTYTAIVDRGRGPEPSNGTYKYDNNKLTFTPSEGGHARTYDADLIVLGHKMRLVGDGPKGEKVTAIMVRQ